MRRLILTIGLITLTASLTGCSHQYFPWVYRIDVEQGNIIEEDELKQVEVGMTRRQVEYLLGTALIKDTFNQSRWDYYYSLKSGDGRLYTNHVVLYFDGNILSSIDIRDYEGQRIMEPDLIPDEDEPQPMDPAIEAAEPTPGPAHLKESE